MSARASTNQTEPGFFALYLGKYDAFLGHIQERPDRTYSVHMVSPVRLESEGHGSQPIKVIAKVMEAYIEPCSNLSNSGVLVFGPEGSLVDGLLRENMKTCLPAEIWEKWVPIVGSGKSHVRVTPEIAGLFIDTVAHIPSADALPKGHFFKGVDPSVIITLFKGLAPVIRNPKQKVIFDQRGVGGSYTRSWVEQRAMNKEHPVVRLGDGILEMYTQEGEHTALALPPEVDLMPEGVYCGTEGDAFGALSSLIGDFIEENAPDQKVEIDITGKLRESGNEELCADLEADLQTTFYDKVSVQFLNKKEEVSYVVSGIIRRLMDGTSKFSRFFTRA